MIEAAAPDGCRLGSLALMTPPRNARRNPLLVSLVALSVGLAACGGSSNSQEDSEAGATSTPGTVAPTSPPSVVETAPRSQDRETDGHTSPTASESADPGRSEPEPADRGDRDSEPADQPASNSDIDAEGERPEPTVAVDTGATSPNDARFSCGASPVLATDWPFYVSEWIQIADLSVEGTRYALAGTTPDLDAVISDSFSKAFVDFDVVERESDRTSFVLDLTSDGVEVMMRVDDGDQDGCWSVEIVAVYDRPPPPVEQPDESDVSAAPAIRSDGNVFVITPRGDFELDVSACRIAPTFVDASSSDGQLRMRSTSGDGVSVRWTYADGEVVADAAAEELYANEISRGVAIGNGTIFVEVAC